MHPALASFIERMDRLVATTNDDHRIADVTSEHLAELLDQPRFLEDADRASSEDGYTQHVVHVHPQGLYSVVSLVWRPGQATPIHDHRCWCVVGVLRGQEREERFTLHEDDGDQWLSEHAVSHYRPGQVCALVPPDENIHRVVNEADETSISIHVYGADIDACGTSINRTFELPVRADGDDETAASWRDRDTERLVRPRT